MTLAQRSAQFGVSSSEVSSSELLLRSHLTRVDGMTAMPQSGTIAIVFAYGDMTFSLRSG
jgi:hypothetical protein